MIHAGGNVADQGIALDTICDNYSTLLSNSTFTNRRVRLTQAYSHGFLLASGYIADSYFQLYKVHINPYGTRKLLQNLDIAQNVT